ncbi:MAG TPA: putative zinc-binding metallopeptidase [Acidimicrobiales bacterium]|jgi:hypothetical protein|nr:putative zinc-binding metallopeptidase [Acidimicrobiales bacterium]
MRIFTCDNCGQLIFFDNNLCLNCESPLGYVHRDRDVIALTPLGDDRFVDMSLATRPWERCATVEVTGCNWLVPAGSSAACESCQLTRTRPNDANAEGLAELQRAEMAKRRLVFQCAELGLPLTPRDEANEHGVAFDLLSSVTSKVVTGHDNGVITLDLAEADDEHREHLRLQLSEPYRTLLGHFRHEIGHYFWPILVDQPEILEACRSLFGDERADYASAVANHYDDPGDDASWVDDHISQYATMHPYEDWAETFAHYLHILDSLQTAESFGLGTHTTLDGRRLTRRAGAHPTRPDGSATFDEVVNHWLELSYALNQINRSMGQDDLYPFVLAPTVVRKLSFIDHLVHLRIDSAALSTVS